jgi:hypothetical protein
VGIVVGTATGATPFQNVQVTNPASSPVLVQQVGSISGSVAVSNFPANQPVTVTNFPASQAVTGTVNVGNLPAAQIANKTFSELRGAFDADSTAVFSFGRTINVSTLIVDNLGSDDEMSVYLQTVAGPKILVRHGEGAMTQQFSLPVPATSVEVFCHNSVFSCDAWVTALGT